MGTAVVRTLVAGAAVAGVGAAVVRYRQDLAAAQARLDAVDRQVIASRFGPVEYAERGTGEPVLVSHGIFHGSDGGLLSVRDMLVDRRVVVPSRFGYLGSAMPTDASAADQAEAFVAVLDRLGLSAVDVVGISAGTGAAVQLALRYPDRVRHLVVSSGNFPGSGTAQAPPEWARVFYSDPAMWLLKVCARPMFAGLMGVPDGFPRGPEDAGVMAEMLESVFPIGPRARGAVFDAYVTNPEINSYPLQELRVPTLIVHAVDDPLASYAAAAAGAARIPGARLVSLESGGHLQLGQADRVRTEVSAFLDS
ncbi:MAG: alpha/beta hydrolase [Propionibacteriaceae bacterium]|nr:alpha/beta hydrolase [Propionibacteriaceae bacterium]